MKQTSASFSNIPAPFFEKKMPNVVLRNCTHVAGNWSNICVWMSQTITEIWCRIHISNYSTERDCKHYDFWSVHTSNMCQSCSLSMWELNSARSEHFITIEYTFDFGGMTKNMALWINSLAKHPSRFYQPERSVCVCFLHSQSYANVGSSLFSPHCSCNTNSLYRMIARQLAVDQQQPGGKG